MRFFRITILLIFFLYQSDIGSAAEPVITTEVTDVNGDEITIGSGEDRGVFKGAEGFVYYMRTVSGKSVRLTIAHVKVNSVSSQKSQLSVVDKSAIIKLGYKVEIQVQPEVTKEPSVENPQKKSKLKWYIIGGAVVIGGVVAASMGGGGGGGGDNGSAVIDVTFLD